MMDVGVPIDGGDGSTARSFEFGTSYHSPGCNCSSTSGAPSAHSHAASDITALVAVTAPQIVNRRPIVIRLSRAPVRGSRGDPNRFRFALHRADGGERAAGDSQEILGVQTGAGTHRARRR